VVRYLTVIYSKWYVIYLSYTVSGTLFNCHIQSVVRYLTVIYSKWYVI